MRLSFTCHCVTLRPCGYVWSLPPMVEKGRLELPAARTIGNCCCTEAKLFGSKMLAYQLAPGLIWFTRLGVKRCVYPNTSVRCGWGEKALKIGLIGSVYAACSPVSC